MVSDDFKAAWQRHFTRCRISRRMTSFQDKKPRVLRGARFPSPPKIADSLHKARNLG
jgi:hypothetical protein